MSAEFSQGDLLADRFEILGMAGSGGMARVYKARDSLLGRIVALKVFSIDTTEIRARLSSEAQLLSSVSEPTLVTIHDAYLPSDPADGPNFLVMEFVDGTTLRELIAQDRIPAADITRVGTDVAAALTAVHAAGIIHRDVKPANILIAHRDYARASMRAKLSDFGIAQGAGASDLTAPGTVIGTAAYLSPEQATGAMVTFASDVYSLGLVLLECFTRRREYPGTAAESLSARLARRPDVPEDLPHGWPQLLKSMLNPAPSARPTAPEVASRLSILPSARVAPSSNEVTSELSTEDIPTRVMPHGVRDLEPIPSGGTEILVPDLAARLEGPESANSTRSRRSLRVALIVVGVVAVAVIAVLLISRLLAAPIAPAPATSSNPPTVATSTTPSPTPTSAPPPGNGKGNSHGKGNGNGHGKNN